MGVFVTAFSYIASLVGAGFASGQELVSFFVKYGKWSVFGILISVIIFSVFAYSVASVCVKEGIDSYDEYLKLIMPSWMVKYVEILTLVFSYLCFFAMASGSGTMGKEIFSISSFWGNLLLCLICLIFFVRGDFKALKYNAVLGFVIILGVITVCLYILGYREHQGVFLNFNIVTSSISYAGYNLIGAGVIIVKLSKLIRTEKEALTLGIISGFCIFIMMFLMWLVINIYYGKINLGEMPMLTLVRREHKIIAVVYEVLLFLSILSTAVSALVSVSEMTRSKYSILMLILGALSFGTVSFSNIINFAYRICGYLGVLLPFYIIIKKLKNMQNRENNRKKEKNREKIIKY